MRPDTASFLSLGSFRNPVPLPVQDPDGEPSISVTVACSWLPYIRGCLYQALLQYTWPQDNPDQVYLAQQRANNLISLFVECEEPIPPISCPYDFQISDAGWDANPPFGHGDYSPGTGWVGVFFNPASVAVVQIEHGLTAPNTITHVEFDAAAEADGCPGSAYQVYLDTGSGPVAVLTVDGVTAGTRTISWDGSVDNVTNIIINCNSAACDNVVVIIRALYRGLSVNGCE